MLNNFRSKKRIDEKTYEHEITSPLSGLEDFGGAVVEVEFYRKNCKKILRLLNEKATITPRNENEAMRVPCPERTKTLEAAR